jgi:signal transduction histidine kinase
VASAIRSFAWRSLSVTLVLGVLSTIFAGRVAENEALRDARRQAAGIADGVTSLVDDRLRAGDPAALSQMDQFFRTRLDAGSLRHVKIWSGDGTIVWADQTSLVGRRFELEEDVRELVGTDDVVAELSEPNRAENAGEKHEGEALEVYVGAEDGEGRPLVFEVYLSTEQMEDNRSAILRSQLPLFVGGLIALLLSLLPLGVALARRVDREESRRTRLTRHALLASDLERRRLVQDLHDGVIQDLAGVTYALPTISASLPSGEEGRHVRSVFNRVHTVLIDAVAALRVMLTDTYPPDVEHGGLRDALAALTAQAGQNGRIVDLEVDPEPLSPTAARLSYRVVREALRNVARHSEAEHVQVRVVREDQDVVVTVVDDGRGMSLPLRAPGHWGLQLLSDTLTELEGRLDLAPTPGGGLTLTARFPAEPV